MSPVTVPISSKENQSVVKVCEVDLNRNVVNPRLNTICEPFRIDCCLEYERVGCYQTFETPRPPIAVNLDIQQFSRFFEAKENTHVENVFIFTSFIVTLEAFPDIQFLKRVTGTC